MKAKILTGITLIIIIVFCVVYFFPKKITNYPSQGTDIVAFGDSLIEGMGSTQGNDLISQLSKQIGQPIINLGNAGDTTADGLARMNQLDEYKPKVVILLFGGNDYLKKVPISETQRNLSQIIQNIHSRGSVVLLLGVRGGILQDRFKTVYETLSDVHKTAYVSDVLDGLLTNTLYMSDSIHPNNLGYTTITMRVAPVLKKLIK